MDIYMEFFGGKLSDGSKGLYLSKLKNLNGGAITTLKFLKKTEPIIEKIEAYENPNTKRSMYIACVSALKDKPEYKKAYDIYHKKMFDINIMLNKESYKNENTKSKQEAVSQEAIIARQKELMDILKVKGKVISDDNYKKLVYLVVCSLYTLIQPRRSLDYISMVVGEPADQEHNYYYKGKFYFRVFKTKNTAGEQIVDVPEELQNIIKVYLKYKKFPEDKHLLHSRDKPQMTDASMSQLIKKAFGMDIGVSLLRNVFLTDKYADIAKELKIDTDAMGTSVNVANSTYIKK